jgi:CBS domain-containing protein
MLQRLILRAQPSAAAARRWISQTRVLRDGQTTMAAMLGSLPGCEVPTADHLMTAERAAQLMAEKHLDALPVIKDKRVTYLDLTWKEGMSPAMPDYPTDCMCMDCFEQVVGVFTEHDYFDKVLSMDHSAVKTSKVCEVATMGAGLVVAYPEDTVEGCLEVMSKKVTNSCSSLWCY